MTMYELNAAKDNVAIAQRDVAVHEAAASNARKELYNFEAQLRRIERRHAATVKIAEMDLPKRVFLIAEMTVKRVEGVAGLRKTGRTRGAFYQLQVFVSGGKLPKWCKNYSPVAKANYILTRAKMLVENDDTKKGAELREIVEARFEEIRKEHFAEQAD